VKSLIIDKQAVKYNVQEIKKRTDHTRIIADLSGDGQGMGLVMAAVMLREEGITSYAVSEVADAVLLRESNFANEEILMLRSTSDQDELLQLVEHNITCTIGSYDAGIALNSVAEARKTVVEVKIEIDTGLGNFGFSPSETDKIINLFKHMGGLAIVGMFTRLSASWKNKTLTKSQLDAFEEAANKITDAGFDPGVLNALDSAALFKYDFEQMDAVCIGSAIIGRIPGKSNFGLTKVGYIEADIEEIDWVIKGSRLGYGGAHTLNNNTRIGVISVGWVNGIGLAVGAHAGNLTLAARLRRLLFNKAANHPTVRINGTKVKVIGSISMTCMAVDLTNVNCSTGDKTIIECDPRLIKGLTIEYR
jgi:alanine racemase